MAIIRCEACGANLDITDGSLIVTCQYCGTKQIITELQRVAQKPNKPLAGKTDFIGDRRIATPKGDKQQLADRRKKISKAAGLIDVVWHDIVGLKADGTVLTYDNEGIPRHIDNWMDIIAVNATMLSNCAVGLKKDGTVIGRSYAWANIISLSNGGSHMVGLKSDGTVVAEGRNDFGQCNVGHWKNIIAVSAGGVHTVGLKSDGTVMVAGDNYDGQCDVTNWQDIVSIAAGEKHTVGLKSDGTVKDTHFVKTSGWDDIIAIAAGVDHTVGLKLDGTVVAAGYSAIGECDVKRWTEIIAIAAGENLTVGLRTDGTVIATGWHKDRSLFRLFDNFDMLEDERKRGQESRAKKFAALEHERQSLQGELHSVKSIVSYKKRSEIKQRLEELDRMLNLI